MFVSGGISATILKVGAVVKSKGYPIGRGGDRRIPLAGLWLDYQVVLKPMEESIFVIDSGERLAVEGWAAQWSCPSISRRKQITVMNCSGDQTKMLRDLTLLKLSGVLHD